MPHLSNVGQRMFSIIRIILGTVAFLIAFPFLGTRRRDERAYGMTAADRDFEICRKFGAGARSRVHAMLRLVANPKDEVLGAIIFLAGSVEQVEDLVSLANSDRECLLRAAVVVDERGCQWSTTA